MRVAKVFAIRLGAMRKLLLLLGRLRSSCVSLENRFSSRLVTSRDSGGCLDFAVLQNRDSRNCKFLGVRYVTGIADFGEIIQDRGGLGKEFDEKFRSASRSSSTSNSVGLNVVRDRKEQQRAPRGTWNLISCNAAISRLAQQGRRGEALAFFFRMQDEHVRPNRVTFLSLLKAFRGPGDLESGRRVHNFILERQLESDVRVGTALTCMYFRCGSAQDAHRVFKRVQNRDIIVWNAMIEGYCQAGLRDKALEMFKDMKIAGLAPDVASFLSILKSCNGSVHLDDGKQLHKAIIESGFELSVRVQTALVNMYCRCESLLDARKMFNKLPRKDIGLWTTMIAGYAQTDHGEEAFALFQAMRDTGLQPNKMTFLALLKACTRPEFLQKGKWLHNHIRCAGLDSDEKVGTALINAYSKCRSLVDARKVFDNLCTRNVISWTALIAAYSRNDRAEEALDLFEQMKREGVQPNEVTRNTVVKACDRLGAV